MKRIFCLLTVLLCLSLFAVPVFAEGADGADMIPNVEASAELPVPAEEKTFAEESAEWLESHLPSLIVILSALWAVFPKYGALPILVATLRKLKTYIDDKENPNSVYNVLAANASVISKFMTDIAPVIEELQRGNRSVEDVLEKVRAEKEAANAALNACQSSMRLMAKELNDLISCSTTISAKTKATIEKEWIAEDAKISAMLAEKGVCPDDGETKGKAS